MNDFKILSLVNFVNVIQLEVVFDGSVTNFNCNGKEIAEGESPV